MNDVGLGWSQVVGRSGDGLLDARQHAAVLYNNRPAKLDSMR